MRRFIVTLVLTLTTTNLCFAEQINLTCEINSQLYVGFKKKDNKTESRHVFIDTTARKYKDGGNWQPMVSYAGGLAILADSKNDRKKVDLTTGKFSAFQLVGDAGESWASEGNCRR